MIHPGGQFLSICEPVKKVQKEVQEEVTYCRTSLWSTGWDCVLSMQGAQVQSLVREVDLTCCN